MSVVISRCWVDKNTIKYKAVSGGSPLGGTGTIPATGGATPDLVTDSKYNGYGEAGSRALRDACNAGNTGLGTVAAGTWTQALARALLMLDAGAVAADSFGGVLAARLDISLAPRDGTAAWVVDVDVDGAGIPEINVTASVAAGTAYIEVSLVHSLSR